VILVTCSYFIIHTSSFPLGGIPEVLTDATGILVEPGQPQQLAEALAVALGRTWDRSAIVAHSQQFSWDNNARILYELLEKSFEQKHAKIAKHLPGRNSKKKRRWHTPSFLALKLSQLKTLQSKHSEPS
jgi:hypothetical protein